MAPLQPAAGLDPTPPQYWSPRLDAAQGGERQEAIWFLKCPTVHAERRPGALEKTAHEDSGLMEVKDCITDWSPHAEPCPPLPSLLF